MKIAFRFLSALIVAAGSALTIGNGMTYATAQLSGIGSNVLTHPAAKTLVKEVFPTDSFIPLYSQATAANQMVVGILLILLGFFIHALLTSHDERSVHITAVPREKRRPHTARFFWIEMRM